MCRDVFKSDILFRGRYSEIYCLTKYNQFNIWYPISISSRRATWSPAWLELRAVNASCASSHFITFPISARAAAHITRSPSQTNIYSSRVSSPAWRGAVCSLRREPVLGVRSSAAPSAYHPLPQFCSSDVFDQSRDRGRRGLVKLSNLPCSSSHLVFVTLSTFDIICNSKFKERTFRRFILYVLIGTALNLR